MTPKLLERLNELKQIRAKATQGEWSYLTSSEPRNERGWIVPNAPPGATYENYDGDLICENGYMSDETAQFIATAANIYDSLLTSLITAVEALEGYVNAVGKTIDCTNCDPCSNFKCIDCSVYDHATEALAAISEKLGVGE